MACEAEVEGGVALVRQVEAPVPHCDDWDTVQLVAVSDRVQTRGTMGCCSSLVGLAAGVVLDKLKQAPFAEIPTGQMVASGNLNEAIGVGAGVGVEGSCRSYKC